MSSRSGHSLISSCTVSTTSAMSILPNPRSIASTFLWLVTDDSCRNTLQTPGPHGPFLAGLVGPYSPTTGTPSIAARCVGPVSPPTSKSVRRISATSPDTLHTTILAAPPLAATTFSGTASSLRTAFTTTSNPRLRSTFANSPNRSTGHCLAPHPPPADSTHIGRAATSSAAQFSAHSSRGNSTNAGASSTPTASASSAAPCSTTCTPRRGTRVLYSLSLIHI